jgi:Rieske Fe-S protein
MKAVVRRGRRFAHISARRDEAESFELRRSSVIRHAKTDVNKHDSVEKTPSCVGNLDGVFILPRKGTNGGTLPAMTSLGETCANRRAIVAALPGLILLPGVVAACSSSPSSPSASTPAAAEVSAQPARSSATALDAVQVQQSQVPVGTAVVVSGYVVAQPAPGQFVAYSAACTHRGAMVSAGNGTTLHCPAHGSEFDGATGAVLNGPASSPLAPVSVNASNGVLTIG